MLTYDTTATSHDMGYLYEACDQISDFCHQYLLRKMRRKISWDGRKDRQTEGRTDRGKTVYPPPVKWWYNKYMNETEKQTNTKL
jgi:hypothetical protein